MLPIFYIKNPTDGCFKSKYHGFKSKPFKNPIMKFIDTPTGSIFMMFLIIFIIFVLSHL